MRITHLFTAFRGMGGVESMLRNHWEHDRTYGIDSQFISYLESPEPPVERVEFLGLSGKTTTREMRRKVANAIAKHAPDICVYHGIWLVKYLADIDQSDRRILQLHGAHTTFGDLTQEVEPWADGVLSISQLQYEGFLRGLPHVPTERIQRLTSPIFPPPSFPNHPPFQNRPFTIGYCGRIADDAKRIDRAPALIETLEKAKLDFRMEFLGEGPLEGQLRERFRSNPRIFFHGRKSGAAYWEAIRNWDFFILFSDSEGTPISILETMSQGVLPIMPGINSSADHYARQLGNEFVYPPYVFANVRDSIFQILQRPESEVKSLRARAAEIVSEHRATIYFSAFAKFLEKIISLPRRSTQVPILPPLPLQTISFDRLASIRAIQRRVTGAFRKSN